MAHEDPRYKVANDLHSLGYPAITRTEAGKAAQLLIKEFGDKKDACASRVVPMVKTNILRRWTDAHPSGARRVWVSPKETAGTEKGWGRLIHDMGHMVYNYRHPGTVVYTDEDGTQFLKKNRPHGDGENAIETHIAYFVRHQTDWLTGSLKEKPKQQPHKLPILEARLARWEAKQSRAETAIKKLNKQIAYYRKKMLKEVA